MRWLDNLRHDLSDIDPGKLFAAPIVWLVIMLVPLATEFDAYAELSGQTWRVGAGDLCAIGGDIEECQDAQRLARSSPCKAPALAQLLGRKAALNCP